MKKLLELTVSVIKTGQRFSTVSLSSCANTGSETAITKNKKSIRMTGIFKLKNTKICQYYTTVPIFH
jgi:hypothetical protein